MNEKQLQAFFEGIIGKTFKYSDTYTYPHGKAISVCVTEFVPSVNEPIHKRESEVRTIIGFSDGRNGNYTFGAYGLWAFFDREKPKQLY